MQNDCGWELRPQNRAILFGKRERPRTQALTDPLKNFFGGRRNQDRLTANPVDLLDPLLQLDDPQNAVGPRGIGRKAQETRQGRPCLVAPVAQEERSSGASVGVKLFGDYQSVIAVTDLATRRVSGWLLITNQRLRPTLIGAYLARNSQSSAVPRVQCRPQFEPERRRLQARPGRQYLLLRDVSQTSHRDNGSSSGDQGRGIGYGGYCGLRRTKNGIQGGGEAQPSRETLLQYRHRESEIWHRLASRPICCLQNSCAARMPMR